MTGEIILNDLAHLPVWVGWREEQRGGRQTKVPYAPRTRKEASSTDPTTWSTRGEAETWATTHRGGVGIVLSQLNGNDCCLCGIDLDTCRDPTTEIFQDWAQEVIDRFATYTEVSPSGTGAKIFFTHASHDLPAIERLFGGKGGRQFKNGGGEHCPAIEIFRAGRYFTVTDESIGPTDILRQVPLADLEWIIREAGPRFAHKESQKSGSSGNDKSRSAKAFRKGAALKAAGHSYKEMRNALLADADPEIADWARTKGLANGERELHRIYDKAGDNGEAKLPPEPNRSSLTIAAWLDRDIPLRDHLLGGVMCTTSRWFIYGETGIGKTLFCMELTAAMAAATKFLKWSGQRLVRVMYIDGEMPVETFKERMELIASRYGRDITFYGYNREDLGDGGLPPLNTPIGQAWLRREIDAIKPDVIVFDSIMCLLIGSLKEDETWAPMKPLVCELSARKIAQVWLNHANDLGKSYGDKTRLWEMDTVGKLSPVEGDAGAIRFEFEKARLRTPANAEQFEPVIFRPGNDWSFSAAAKSEGAGGKGPSMAWIIRTEFMTAYDRLADGVTKTPGFDGAPVAKVATSSITAELKTRGYLPLDEKGSITVAGRQMLSTAKAQLLKSARLVENDSMVWRT